MKNTRKYIALIAALALLFSLFAGCGKAEMAATTSAGKTETAASGMATSASSSSNASASDRDENQITVRARGKIPAGPLFENGKKWTVKRYTF